MGNAPSESNMGDRLKCCKCKEVLPPCRSFSDFYKSTIHGREVYVFNGGEYYRPVGGHMLYECQHCFNKLIRDRERMKTEEEQRRREEMRRREEERRREEMRRREEERRREEGRKMKEELDRTLEESQRQAQAQHKKQLSLAEERESKQNVLISQLDEFKANYESGSDKLLETLSSKCNFPIPNLDLNQLTSDQLSSIVSALDKLLFDEWITTPPSLCTLQHAQVFITELCVLSLQTSEDISLKSILNQVQSLVGSISQSASNTCENLMLTQALYFNLMHFLTDPGSCDSDAALIAKRWSEKPLSTEDLFLVEFLGTLTSSLQNAVERATVFILKMEMQCLKLLLFTLTHLHDKESHSKSTEMLLRLVQTNQWTPAEAVALLKALSEKYAEEAPVTEVLTLVHIYAISPQWTDDSGRTLVQALDFIGPDRFQVDFQKTLRKQEKSRLDSALAELKTWNNLDDSEVDLIRNIITSVLQYSENTRKDKPFTKDFFKCANTSDIQNALSQLCQAVLNTKGWWPTVQHMVKWCVSVLKDNSRVLELVGVEEDPCVTAMIAAAQACRGNKLDIVLCSDAHVHEQTNEWSDFYKYLGISVNTNMKKSNVSGSDVYKADIVYGTMDDFVSDYFQYGLEVMETGNPHLCRGLIIEKRCLTAYHYPELSKLKENEAMAFAAEILESLMCDFLWDSEDINLRHGFIKALFQVLHMNLNKHTDADSKIITISQKLTGKQLSSVQIYILSILENLVCATETETEENRAFTVGKLCLDRLFDCAVQFQASNEQTTELYGMVSNLVAQQLWSPVEALNLLVALTNHSPKKNCISFMKILHLMEIYQVSSEWRDEKNKSICELLSSWQTENMIQHLENSFRDEQEKSIDSLFDEIRQMKNIDEQTLKKSYSVVKAVTNLIKSGEIKKHTNVQHARNLSRSTDTEDLQKILAVLCYAVYVCNAKEKWWPRATQMISWCLLVLSDTGKLLEMGTGEGKSCVIAMFAVLRALRGEKVDVVSSSSVLCQRDAKEWSRFYKYFGITVDMNTNKTEDKDRKECYQKDVVYGTIEAFAADHLRQVFEMKDVRTDRSYQCIVIDEVDSLLLDQGVQLTYLSSPMVSMQHLNVILAMIWGHVCQYGLLTTGHQTFVQAPPAAFFKAIFDSIDTEGINDPLDILQIAEESKTVPEGFTEDFYKSQKDELPLKLKTVSQEDVVDFFQDIEQYVPYGFTVYTLDGNGLLYLQKSSKYNHEEIPELTFLVLGEGLCCALYESEETLIKPIAEFISEKIQYTPCTNNTNKVSIPGFLRSLIEKKLPVWVQNAFLAMRLKQGREYVVDNDSVCPVDFRSTGIVEQSKKWGDGLQQFIEIKHQIKLSTISTVTNYISNISFFEKYHGQIYGTTGTLGCETDMLFLQEIYPNLSACKMPTFNRKKLFEVEGTLKTSAEDWKAEIKHVVMSQISPNSYREGRAALVICETINTATELYEDLKSIIPGKIIPYTRSDKNSLMKIDEELNPGDVIVATNLAGRGTDIKVSKKVNNNGGLFVVLSFLSENQRVELQAFGRTARKGKPGSAMVIMATDHLQESYGRVSSLEEVKKTRDRFAAERVNDMRHDTTEMKLREDLFSEYCKALQEIYRTTDGDEQRAVVSIMNEFWGIWLQIKSDKIDTLKRNELQNSLKADLASAKSQSQSKTSPCSSIYHYIKFGNIALDKKQWDISMKLFEKAMDQDESWAAIAFYSHAYCTIKQQKGDYLTKARDDLRKAQESLQYLSEECMVCLQLVKMSSANSANADPSSLEHQLITKCNMFSYFDKNIDEAIKKLEEIKERGRDAVANKSTMFSLVSGADEEIQEEAYNLYTRGLEYVFSVEEEPRFPWGALLVFCLGVLQIIGGALLTAFTFGTLAQVGMGLVTEGISDCIHGIECMVTGEFSWKAWAVEKAISIGVSLIGFGVAKLIAKGFKASSLLIKGLSKLKPIPKFLSSQVKEGLSVVAKTNMKNAAKYAVKRIAEEVVIYGFGKAEEKLLTEILNDIKNDVKKGIVNDVKSNMKKEPMAVLINSIVLSHLQDKQQLSDLLQDKNRKSKLLDIFKELSNAALQPFYADLSWQHKLNTSISSVIDKAKAKQTKGKIRAILTTIQAVHMGSLATDAIRTVLSLSNRFFSNLHEELNKFITNNGALKKEKQTELSATETQMLKEFKQDLADTISALLADALTEVFHQKFSSHIVSRIKGHVNGIIGNYVRTILKTDRTEEKLRAGQHNRYIAHMPADRNSKQKQSVNHSESHAEKIKSQTTPGTILDARVLSETTGTHVIILTQDSQGRLTKMQQLSPSTKPANQTVKLIYYPKSPQHPDGHYNVLINNQRVSVTNKGKSCLFHALARGMNPNASEQEIALEADRLRSVEANTLLRNPHQWEPFIKRKEWTEAIRGGDWYMAEGSGDEITENIDVLRTEVGRIERYKNWKKYRAENPGIGQFINGDHQPQVESILLARQKNPNSRLAEAMLEVATNSSPLNINLISKVKNNHGLELPTVYVPTEIHREFPSTKSRRYWQHLADVISKDDVVGAFKLTFIGALPRFRVNSAMNFKNFQDSEISKSRLSIFEQSFQQHTKNMTQKWFDLLRGKGVMTDSHLNTINTWIDKEGYKDQNDPYRNQVADLLSQTLFPKTGTRTRKRSLAVREVQNEPFSCGASLNH